MLWNKVINQAIKDNPADLDAAIINVWMLMDSEELQVIFSARKEEIFQKYSVFKHSNGTSACILKKLLAMDDSMIELSLSKGLLDHLAKELKSPTILPLAITGIVEAIASSRAVYLDLILTHSSLWKVIKKVFLKKRLSPIAPWLANALIKSLLVATAKQIYFMLSEDVLLKIIVIVSNTGDHGARGFMQAVDIGIEKISKIVKKTKDKRGIECIEKLRVIPRSQRHN